jgi:cyclopropane fatty-acyl-phospholipid synthase-like methyltransferase
MTTAELYKQGEYLERNPTWHVEDSPWKAQQVLRMLTRAGLKPRTVCEVGCGAGEILRQLHDRLAESGNRDVSFVGYEISPQAHTLSRPRATDRLSFRLEDPLSDAGRPQTPFDLVLAMDVVEHVEDYFGFLRRLRGLGTHKVFHIPLDISAYSAMGATLMRGRRAMGHIQYFTRATALATLQECGYEVVDHFYTFGAIEAPGAPNKSAAAKALRLARRMLYYINRELMVRGLGGASVLVLAK